MKKVTNILVPIFCILVTLGVIIKLKPITVSIANLLRNNKKVIIKESNQYAKNTDYLFVQKTNTFVPYNYQDLLNIYYSILDNGYDKFTFYCPSEYTSCLEDIKEISKDKTLLSHINNYVSPYNCFKNIITEYDETGKIHVTVEKLYTKDEIEYVETRLDEILNNEIDLNTDQYNQLKRIHDYIINNTRYDEESTDNEITDSSKASGLLKNGIAKCNGYSDIMAIILNRLNINNYKIATNPSNNNAGHVWNAVYYNNEWVHLDLTWDDPVSSNKENYLYHKYFLVNTEGVNKADSGEVVIDSHNFKESIYLEYKNNS